MTRVKRFFIDQGIPQDGVIKVHGDELHHMIHVLRLRVGETVEIFDGSGNGYLAEITSIQKGSAELCVKESIQRSSESPLNIILLQSVFKMDKMELMIQKATELGVFQIVPILSMHSVIKKEAVAKRTVRWQKIATEASKQSGRLQTPQIMKPLEFESIPDLKEEDFGILLHASDQSRTLSEFREAMRGKKIVIAIGPEGGWDQKEVALAIRKGFVPVTLGPRTLRSETSGIVMLGLIQFLVGDMDR